MGVLFLFVFVVVLTISALYGNGSEDASDRAERMGSIPAGQMVALHAAVSRACVARPDQCPANSYIYKSVSGPFLAPPYLMSSRPFQDGDYRYGSWFDGNTVYTYYTGIQNAQVLGDDAGAQMRGSVTAWLDANMPRHTMGNVGVYDASRQQFVARGYAATTRYQNVSVTTPSANPTSTVLLGAGVPNGAPLLRSRIKG